MKPGNGPKRRKGLTTRTPLLPKQPLKRIPATGSSWVQPKRKPMRPGKYTGPKQTVKEIVEKRSGWVCEIQMPGVCTGVATDPHHRAGRGMGGSKRPALNEAHALLHVCRKCHDAVTDTRGNRAVYEDARWIVPRGAEDIMIERLKDPVLYRGRWVLLTDDGGTITAEKGKAA